MMLNFRFRSVYEDFRFIFGGFAGSGLGFSGIIFEGS